MQDDSIAHVRKEAATKLEEGHFFAHSENSIGVKHELKKHLIGTATLTESFAPLESMKPLFHLAGLLHDVGKPDTREFGPGGVTFHHHEVVGARMARRRLRELRYPREIVEDVAQLVYLHLRPHTLKLGWTDSAVRRYVRDAGHLLEPLNELVRCDVTTANRRREEAIQGRIDELEERIAQLSEQEELARLEESGQDEPPK